MIVDRINDLEHLNALAYNVFLDDQRNDLIPYDTYCAYVIKTNSYTALRNSISSGVNFSSYKEQLHQQEPNLSTLLLNNDVLSLLELYNPSGSDSIYFYPFNKNTFIQSFFPSVVPTLSSHIFDLLKSTGRIIQIGSGLGKSFIINPSLLTQSHFDSMPVAPSVSDIVSLINNSLSDLTSIVSDKQFYLDQIAKRDQIIDQLNQEIAALNNKIGFAYQTTWR